MDSVVVAKPTHVDAYKAWVKGNPLRIWRHSHSLSLRALAALLGVNLYTVQSWEQGSSMPNDDNTLAIAKLVNDTTFKAKWQRWYHARPN